MSEIHVKEGESLDSALKRFKRSCAKAGIVAEVRKRECYESPSVKRRKKSAGGGAACAPRHQRGYSLRKENTPFESPRERRGEGPSTPGIGSL